MSRQTQQIVELQDLIDSLTRMKLNLQVQSGNSSFSDVVSNYSTEKSQSSEGKQTRKDELRQIRSRIDRLFHTFESQQQ